MVETTGKKQRNILRLVLFAFFHGSSNAFFTPPVNYYHHQHYHQQHHHHPPPRRYCWNRNHHRSRTTTTSQLCATAEQRRTVAPATNGTKHTAKKRTKIVLVAGFESFNRDLYYEAARGLEDVLELVVFSDADIRVPRRSAASNDENDNADATTQSSSSSSSNVQNSNPWTISPEFQAALETTDAFIGSLIFDYDDAVAVQQLLPHNVIEGPCFIFESATELMSYNHVGTFSMMKDMNDDSPAGPPPAVKAILSKFGSGKEEDKLSAYLQLLKVGPDLLKFVPGEKAGDLRDWLTAYRYWNQGGKGNVRAMLQLILQRCGALDATKNPLPELLVTPDIGIVHPLRYNSYTGMDVVSAVAADQQTQKQNPHAKSSVDRFFQASPCVYLQWRLDATTKSLANEHSFTLAPDDAPRVAVLLYRKHVVTEQKYIPDLIAMMEKQGILPIPIFINGVEAHTIVRDLLTSKNEMSKVRQGVCVRDTSYEPTKAVEVDAIVNTIGFPLVGGPAGSMEVGRNVAVAEQLLASMDVPYIVASPLLLQSIPQWKSNGVLGLQSVVLYSLPELDGAVDSVVLGGLVGDKIALVPERVRKLTGRVNAWVQLRRKPAHDRKIAVSLYGFPPNVGAVGTAALLDVPRSLEALIKRLSNEGYDTGDFVGNPNASGESLVAALSILCENAVVSGGAHRMQQAVEAKIQRAVDGDKTVAATLARPYGGLGGATVLAKDVSPAELENMLGKYMMKKVRRAWPEKERGPGVNSEGNYVVSGLQVGNLWIFVQPLLGIEGDPMRLLFERDLTPHPQYIAAYEWMRLQEGKGGYGADAVVHLGMHGTVEWLPGQPLGNDKSSWSDQLLGSIPNMYVYAANNPSESILAKRRGYGTIVSYNVPPYGRSGLYLELASMKELIDEYRADLSRDAGNKDLCQTIYDLARKNGILNDVPLFVNSNNAELVSNSELPERLLDSGAYNQWICQLSDYLGVLQDRLFSSGLRVLGSAPKEDELDAYLEAYFGERLCEEQRKIAISRLHQSTPEASWFDEISSTLNNLKGLFRMEEAATGSIAVQNVVMDDAVSVARLLAQSTQELDSVVVGLDGGYIKPAPGGDLLRDGTSVLPSGRNIHSLDPYRMPSAGAWIRGQKVAEEVIRQHKASNNGMYPETIAVTLWGLDAIKTRGESVAIVLALVGAHPVKEGTGRIVRYDLLPLKELGRPRIDVLVSLSGIFRDSFANVVDLLDDMFERCAALDEPHSTNFVKKHSDELLQSGTNERTAARLFSNPPGDYGSMVNEVVGTGDWDDSEELGETWRGRNVFSYGRNEGASDSAGTARPDVLDKLLETTERIVQEVDSVEYGLSDIQEYYANTGALKVAAENSRKPMDGDAKKVTISVVEAFGTSSDNIQVQNVEEVLRLEYRSKLLNPKWRDKMMEQGSGGAFEISQRMTAMIGWAATTEVDDFVFDQAAQRYTEDADIVEKLQGSNPEAFKNVVRRLLEAAGRGMWQADEDTLQRLQDLYSDADDRVEQGSSP